MMNTIIPLYAYDLGAAAQIVGFVTGAFAITALLARPFLGPALDAFSRKRIAFCAALTITLATLLYSFSDAIPLLLFSRLLHGLGMACSAPVLMTMACEALPKEKMSTGVSVYGLAYAVANAVGPALGIWLVGIIGYRWTFHVATLLMAIAALLVFILKEPGKKPDKPYELKLSRMFAKEACLPALLCGLLSASFSCISAFIVIYGGLRGIGGIGYYFTVYAVCLLATRPLFGVLSDKHGLDKVIPIGLGCFILSLFIIGVADSLPWYLLAAAIGAFGYGAVLPLLQSLALLRATSSSRGAASNTNYAGLDLGNLLGPTIGGAIAGGLCSTGLSEVQAYSAVYFSAIIPVALALVLFIMFLGKRKRAQEEEKGAGNTDSRS